jgi:hypothetical protein
MATDTQAAICDVGTLSDAVGDAQHQQDDCLALVEAAAATQQSKAVDKKVKQKAQVRSTPGAMPPKGIR